MEIVCLPLTLRELSHELRTPLTGILGMARILEDLPLTPEQKSYVEDIINQGNKLVQLANDLTQAKTLASQVSIGTIERVAS